MERCNPNEPALPGMEKLSLVASANLQGVFFSDQEKKITYANEALARITGYRPEELIGRTPMEMLHGPLTQEKSILELAVGHQVTGPADVDILLYRKDGTPFWANVRKQPVEKSAPGGQEYFSFVEDITEKKRIEENLRDSENRLASLIRNLKEGILLEDENRRIIITNDTFCSMFGIPAGPEQMIGADCSMSAEQSKGFFRDPEGFVQRVDHVLAAKKNVLAEELEMADGRYLERDYIPIFIDQHSKGHLWKYRDITERKNQERKLRQQEEKYRNIIANMKMGLLETDNDDIIGYVNHQFCEMTGYACGELLGQRSIALLVADEFRPKVREMSLSRKDGGASTYELQIRRKNGDIRWWLTSGGPNYNDRGELVGTVGISVDITEQKELQRELEVARRKAEESSNAKEAFLANMSHEIRTPLNAIIGLIREISREPLSSRQEFYIKNAGLASQHLLSILNDILDITKIESGQLRLELHAFSLRDLIREVVSILAPAAKEKMLQTAISVSGDLAPAYIGDSSRIKQALLNIVNNSIKFTEKGSVGIDCTVTALRPDRHRILVNVTDTGIGMDEDFVDHIFEKFSQGDFTAARRYGGTGLGMAITHELIRLMNGTITVSSKKNAGTVVGITLEMETGNAEEIRGTTVEESFGELEGKRVLVVEDNDLNRLVVLNTLSHYGMIATEAVNGIDAIDHLKKDPFDIILMDLQMPVMGGIEATNFIRKEMRLEIPVIALTAHAFKAEMDRCLEAGMNDYITKPFEENTLLGTILRHLNCAAPAPVAPVEAAPADVKRYDLDYIRQFSKGNPDFVKKMVMLFLEQVPASVAEIRKALAQQDLDAIGRVAHRIKPSIDYFGIGELKQEIRSIETLAGEGENTPELAGLIARLEEVISRVTAELERELQ